MMIKITNIMCEVAAACAEMADALNRHSEWFYSEISSGGSTQDNSSAMRSGEWSIEVMHGGGIILFVHNKCG